MSLYDGAAATAETNLVSELLSPRAGGGRERDRISAAQPARPSAAAPSLGQLLPAMRAAAHERAAVAA
eukprot:2974794-Prymnesium_polylepis.1